MQACLDVAAWRRQERKRLRALRDAVPREERRPRDERVTAFLLEAFPMLAGRIVGFYWPMAGEFDCRVAVLRLREKGSKTALPVVIEKASPLEFREWWPGIATAAGVFDLPVPQGVPPIVPEAVLVPPVGFDARGYRLGYGGGYFDRTLAALSPQPLKIGVAHEASRIETIHPQAHDIPMDFIVTERGVHAVEEAGLRAVQAEEAAARAERIVEHRKPLEGAELAALLNTLLEAERAGAKVLSAYVDSETLSPTQREELLRVQRDEARNCAVLMQLLRLAGAEPSRATGYFLQKALAVEGLRPRLELLNRGQAWVARRLDAAVPRIADPGVREPLREMQRSHVANIEACGRLLG